MIDTPLTKAEIDRPREPLDDIVTVDANFAAQLESKLIATQWDLKVAKERIELLMSANADVARIAAGRDAAERRVMHLEAALRKIADVARIAAGRDAAEKRVMHLEAALRKIADQDYRGPRSTESEIALRALEVKP
jgi:hypothetical protein